MSGSEVEALFASAAECLGTRLTESEPCAGGDINAAWKLTLTDDREIFLKSRPDAPLEEFQMEAAGLRWLAEAGTILVPAVLGVVEQPVPALMLEWVEPGGRLDANGEEEFGRGLAGIHRIEATRYGQLPEGAPDRSLHVGPVDLGRCVEADSGRGFGPCYAARLEGLVRQAINVGRIDTEAARQITTLCARIDQIAGVAEPPALTHGDLWSGNLLVTEGGRPCLVDPAAHAAHREMDLAMLALFGAPSDRFLAAYKEEFPLEPDFRQRVELWQVQPLLIHAILFGGSYGAAAARAARGYL
jgi:fructosamine-3-kinase